MLTTTNAVEKVHLVTEINFVGIYSILRRVWSYPPLLSSFNITETMVWEGNLFRHCIFREMCQYRANWPRVFASTSSNLSFEKAMFTSCGWSRFNTLIVTCFKNYMLEFPNKFINLIYDISKLVSLLQKGKTCWLGNPLRCRFTQPAPRRRHWWL